MLFGVIDISAFLHAIILLYIVKHRFTIHKKMAVDSTLTCALMQFCTIILSTNGR